MQLSLSGQMRRMWSILTILAVLAFTWEAYKWMGQTTGGVWPGTDMALPIRTNARSMPHLWDIAGSLFRPARRGGEDILLVILLRAGWFTLRSALIGFVVGCSVGFGLGLLFVRSKLAERGLMPYVVASQTVPVIAIAPILVVWGGRLDLPKWVSVAAISAYLAFFPVAINTLRGLRSPAATATELMRSYAASPNQTLFKLQIPAALPYLFPALKVAATASVIGAIVGELPAGLAEGLGRAILGFASSFSSSPEKLFASVVVSALVGLVFVGVVALIERLVLPSTRRIDATVVKP
ncbi:MAG: ABC transporter permease subunit [Acidimicrobiia bacterium]|nr:ABC transporter permease subunit [Acidimicrobiia bacterium]NNL47473.1 ABC transporter permease subunit [Acidimicrobiia bacterium]